MDASKQMALDFLVFERPVHPELFTIYASRRFFQGDYEALIWITGSSHVVSVFTEGNCLSEVICPPSQLLPVKGLVQRFNFQTDRSFEHEWANGLNYITNFQVEKTSENLYQRVIKDLKAMAKKRGMFVTHPQPCDAPYPSVSYLDYEARVEELHIHAFHALAEPQVVIKSQTLFRLHSQWVNGEQNKSRKAAP